MSGSLLASGGLDGATLVCSKACSTFCDNRNATWVSMVGRVGFFHSPKRCVCSAGHVGIWDTASGRCKHSLEGPGGAIDWVDWHPRGDIVVAGSDDFTAWLWNAQTAACMQVDSRFLHDISEAV